MTDPQVITAPIADYDVDPFLGKLSSIRLVEAIKEYCKHTHKTAIYPGAGTPEGKKYTALELGEVGEVANILKKALRDTNGVLSEQKLRDVKAELGGLMYGWSEAIRCDTLPEEVSQETGFEDYLGYLLEAGFLTRIDDETGITSAEDYYNHFVDNDMYEVTAYLLGTIPFCNRDPLESGDAAVATARDRILSVVLIHRICEELGLDIIEAMEYNTAALQSRLERNTLSGDGDHR